METSKGLPDLWPKDLGAETGGLIPPVTLLRAQAARLAERTNGILEGKVESVSSPDGLFLHSLIIIAPALGNYRYELLRVQHRIELYPLEVLFFAGQTRYTATDPGNFIESLRNLLGAPETRRVVQALIAQSTPSNVPESGAV